MLHDLVGDPTRSPPPCPHFSFLLVSLALAADEGPTVQEHRRARWRRPEAVSLFACLGMSGYDLVRYQGSRATIGTAILGGWAQRASPILFWRPLLQTSISEVPRNDGYKVPQGSWVQRRSGAPSGPGPMWWRCQKGPGTQ